MISILTHAGYRHDKAMFEVLQQASVNENVVSAGPLTLSFDTTTRYCTGWYDLAAGESHPCSDAATIDAKYTQCPTCQRRTGFNPAFYHASSVSKQQDARNHQPHFLYLAYFAPGAIKVGISFEGRGHARLFEQGARAAMILETFPTALIARHYEAMISDIDGVYENLTARKKRELWPNIYNCKDAESQLQELVRAVSDKLSIDFPNSVFIDINPRYFFGPQPNLDEVTCRDEAAMISGEVVGCIGTELITRSGERLLSLNLKHFLGYPVRISDNLSELELPPVQGSLF